MSGEDNMREEFEAWWSQVWPDMTSVTKSKAERIWKASRESLVIELPQPFEGDDFTMYDGKEIIESIHAAGVKTK